MGCYRHLLSRYPVELQMNDVASYLHSMLTGPGHLRLIIQPILAIVLGLRDGRRDAHLGHDPYLWLLLRAQGQRESTLKLGLRAVAVPLVVAILLDGLLQLVINGRVRVIAALLAGSFLIALPYGLSRGISNRLVTRRKKTMQQRNKEEPPVVSAPPPPPPAP